MKPRSDSKLKTLPEDRQEQVIAWTKAPKTEDGPGGLQHAREQLAADGIKVSLRALSEFVSWYQLQQRFASASSRAQQIEELLRKKRPDMQPEQIREMGQALFTLEAVDAGDAATFVNLESLKLAQDSAKTRFALEEQKLKLAGRRVAVLEKKLERAGQIVKAAQEKGGMTPETLARLEKELKML